jgi:GntR family transcriptional regulator
LRADLLRGGYPDGRLPGEPELMAEYDASRGVIREALSLLRDEGLVRRLTGAGTLVSADPNDSPLPELHGVVVANDPSPLTIRPVPHTTAPMPPVVSRLLGRPAGSPCLIVEYLAYQGAEPLATVTNYVAWPHADSLADVEQYDDFYSYLRRTGLSVGRTDMIFDARPADASTAELLAVPVGRPLLGFEQVIVDEQGTPYDFAVGSVRGDRMRLVSQAVAPSPKPSSPQPQ